MIDFKTPADHSEALAILRAMREGVKIENPGGTAHRPAEVIATIGENFLFYNSAYCTTAQKRDGLWPFYDFSRGTPFWLEDLRTGQLQPINAQTPGARQLLDALRK